MGRRYKNSPITEAVCEFRFGNVANWDVTTPGIIYNEVQTKFPYKEAHSIQEVNFTTEPPSPKTQVKRIDLARFLTTDKKTLIQLGDGILSVSRLKPYTAWHDFKSDIDYAFNTLKQKVELNSIQRIGLRYINRIELQEEKAVLENYFNFRPFLGDYLHGKDYNSFIVGCMFPLSNGRDICKVELQTAVSENSKSSALSLDIDYFLVKPENFQLDQSLAWVEEAHEEVENFFEGCIKQPLRDLFCVEE